MLNILFEDHTFSRLRPLCWSRPTYEVRCGLFNLRERVELTDPGQGGLLLSRELLRPLHQVPAWSTTVTRPTGRTLWLNGRLAPRAELVQALVGQRDHDWVLRDDAGLLAASLTVERGGQLLASWQQWEKNAWDGSDWAVAAEVSGLPAPELPGLVGPLDLGWVWDIVPATSQAIAADLTLVGASSLERHPFGVMPEAGVSWQGPGTLDRVSDDSLPGQVVVTGGGGLYLGSGGVEIAAGVHIDTSGGAVVLDSGVRVMAHTYLAGPLFVGRHSIIKPGARIFGESSFGVGNRLAGEIGESTFGDFANKQHAGFIGHAVLGSWINLGAGTTCSDLKNNYGEVRVDLGDGPLATGQRFVGLLMGDHAKTAIGTMFNTGTTVGFASNVFGGEMPPKHVPGFSWGGQPGAPTYDRRRAQATAAVVVGRRGCLWSDEQGHLFDFLHGLAAGKPQAE